MTRRTAQSRKQGLNCKPSRSLGFTSTLTHPSNRRKARALVDSPIGRLEILAGSGGVERITKQMSKVEPQATSNSYLSTCQKALKSYFLRTSEIPVYTLNPIGTPFQLEVWKVLLTIPYGETRSYHDIARTIGRPKAVRAVANAIGKNPILILIPCHRVIRKNGEIGGFSAGVLIKRTLLHHEGIDV